MESKFYEQNMAALRVRSPALADAVSSLPEDPAVELLESKSGVPTVKVNGIFFHSAYAPLVEADYLLQEVDPKKYNNIVFIGMGLGYHIKRFWNNPYFQGKIVIVEKNAALFKKALMASDWTKLIADRMVIFAVGDDVDQTFRTIEECGFFQINMGNMGIVIHPPSTQVFMPYYLPICKRIRGALGFMRGSFGALRVFHDYWVKNAMEDLVDVVASPGLSQLERLAEGIPAIVVSAGPSLDNDIETLKKEQGKAVIFAVGTAYRVLLKHGIRPDFVVVVDAHEVILKQFKDIDPAGTYLIAANFIRKEIIDQFIPRVFFYYSANNPYYTLLPASQNKKGDLFAGGSVAHTAVDAAVKMGCNPVILVGQDLSYGTDGSRSYASGSVYDGKSITYDDEDDFKRKGLLWVKGNYDDKVLTGQTFYVFISSFEKYLRQNPHVEIINATSGGAFIEGAKLIRLAEVMARYERADARDGFMHTVREIQATFEPDWEGFREVLENAHERFVTLVKDIEIGYEKAKQFKLLLEEGHTVSDEVRNIPQELVELGTRLDEEPFTALLQWGTGYMKFLEMNMQLKLAPTVPDAQEIFCNSIEDVYKGFLDSARFIKEHIEFILEKGELWKKIKSIK